MPFLDTAPRLTERQFQSQVTRYAALQGWRAYHTYRSDRSAPGFPDLVLVRRPRIVWAELKSERGHLPELQHAWLDDLRACGQEVHVWFPRSWPILEKTLA